MAEQSEPLSPAEFTERYGLYLKIAALVFLSLFLLAPVQWIDDLVGERKGRRAGAVSEIARSWGGPQSVVGPYLVVPFRQKVAQPPVWDKTGRPHERPAIDQIGYFVLFPDAFTAKSRLDPVSRYRGIYRATVYDGTLALKGRFSFADFGKQKLRDGAILWDRARLVIGISGLRSLKGSPRLTWAGKPASFLPGTDSELQRSGMHAPVALAAPEEKTGVPPAVEFEIALKLAGSGHFAVAPVGKANRLTVNSTWPHPKFGGQRLPDRRAIDASGFSAHWSVSSLSRTFPQLWRSHLDGGAPNDLVSLKRALRAALSGVSLVTPVDLYLKVERATKYAFLFIALVIATIFSYEVTARLRLHFVQYALVGAALCVFYLLLLSMSEVIGFMRAYALAASMATAMVALYVVKVAASWRRGAVVAGLLGSVYAYLYVVLQLEDFALLAGSVGVFVALAAIMYATRNVDWGRLQGQLVGQRSG